MLGVWCSNRPSPANGAGSWETHAPKKPRFTEYGSVMNYTSGFPAVVRRDSWGAVHLFCWIAAYSFRFCSRSASRSSDVDSWL